MAESSATADGDYNNPAYRSDLLSRASVRYGVYVRMHWLSAVTLRSFTTSLSTCENHIRNYEQENLYVGAPPVGRCV